jgi:zinc protease
MKDRVANTRLYRNWAVPGMLDRGPGAARGRRAVLGGLASSRLDNELVRKDQTAVRVSAACSPSTGSACSRSGDVKPGVDADAVVAPARPDHRRLHRAARPQDEVQRAVMRDRVRPRQGLEQVGGFGGKAVALAEGALYANDPEFYKKQLLKPTPRSRPAQVRAAMQRWLRRPVFALRVDPGEREAYEEAPGRPRRAAAAAPSQRPVTTASPRSRREAAGARPLPASRTRSGRRRPSAAGRCRRSARSPALDFPDVERATLSNGIQVVYARRATVPVTRVAVEFDAGVAADPASGSAPRR